MSIFTYVCNKKRFACWENCLSEKLRNSLKKKNIEGILELYSIKSYYKQNKKGCLWGMMVVNKNWWQHNNLKC